MMKQIFLAALVAAFAGCDSGVVGDATTVGDYTLKTINGSSLPYTLNNTQYLDDVISLTEAGTYIENAHYRVTANGQTTDSTFVETGSYTYFGTSVTLVAGVGTRSRIAVIENSNKLTIVENGVTAVYRK